MASPLRDRAALVRDAARSIEQRSPHPNVPGYPRDSAAAAALVRVVAARRQVEIAERELEAALGAARLVPVPLRALARATGKSHGALAEWLTRRGL